MPFMAFYLLIIYFMAFYLTISLLARMIRNDFEEMVLHKLNDLCLTEIKAVVIGHQQFIGVFE